MGQVRLPRTGWPKAHTMKLLEAKGGSKPGGLTRSPEDGDLEAKTYGLNPSPLLSL